MASERTQTESAQDRSRQPGGRRAASPGGGGASPVRASSLHGPGQLPGGVGVLQFPLGALGERLGAPLSILVLQCPPGQHPGASVAEGSHAGELIQHGREGWAWGRRAGARSSRVRAPRVRSPLLHFRSFRARPLVLPRYPSPAPEMSVGLHSYQGPVSASRVFQEPRNRAPRPFCPLPPVQGSLLHLAHHFRQPGGLGPTARLPHLPWIPEKLATLQRGSRPLVPTSRSLPWPQARLCRDRFRVQRPAGRGLPQVREGRGQAARSVHSWLSVGAAALKGVPAA